MTIQGRSSGSEYAREITKGALVLPPNDTTGMDDVWGGGLASLNPPPPAVSKTDSPRFLWHTIVSGYSDAE